LNEDKLLDSEKLINEAHQNISRDRERLEKFFGNLESLIESSPTLLLSSAQDIGTIADCLTKLNSQLIELTKVRVKKEYVPEESVDPLEDIYKEIEKDQDFN
jgi:hypothetical protein